MAVAQPIEQRGHQFAAGERVERRVCQVAERPQLTVGHVGFLPELLVRLLIRQVADDHREAVESSARERTHAHFGVERAAVGPPLASRIARFALSGGQDDPCEAVLRQLVEQQGRARADHVGCRTPVQTRGATTPAADAAAAVEHDDHGIGGFVQLAESRFDETSLPLRRFELAHPRLHRAHPLSLLLDRRPQKRDDECDREPLGDEQQAGRHREIGGESHGEQGRQRRDERRHRAAESRARRNGGREQPELRLVGDTERPAEEDSRAHRAKANRMGGEPLLLASVQSTKCFDHPGQGISHGCTTAGCCWARGCMKVTRSGRSVQLNREAIQARADT